MDALLNWLFQGLLLAVAAAAVLTLVPQARAQARYGLVAAAYLFLLLLPAVPALTALVAGRTSLQAASLSTAPVVTVPVEWWTSSAVISSLWLTWIAVRLFGLIRDFAGVRAAQRTATACPADLLERLAHWRAVRDSGRAAPVVLSNHVRFASVLGCGSPVIGVSPRLIAELPPEDLDRVLLHEWAHIQRRDDIARAAQELLRVVIGWHPATWWLDRQLELEREAACDARVVQVTGAAKAYASCLVTLAALPVARMRMAPGLSALSSTTLRARLVRILARTSGRTCPWRAVTAGGALALALCALMAGNVQVAVAAVVPLPALATVATHLPRWVTAAAPTPHLPVEVSERRGPAPASSDGERRPPAPLSTSEAPPPDALASATAINGLARHAEAPLEAAASLAQTASAELAPPALSPESVQAPEPQRAPVLEAVAISPPPQADGARSPWQWAADTGTSISRGSKAAGVATAGFFSRFGKKVARSF